jgi:hypothetical protein
MTPNNGQASVRPSQRIIVDLSFNLNLNLSTFAWFYNGQTNHNGVLAGGFGGYAQSRLFPRISASGIQSLQIKINGGIKVDMSDYNFMYNMLHDYSQGADALKRRQVCGENSDPSYKFYVEGNDILEHRGYDLGRFIGDDTLNNVLRDRQEYCVSSWLSLLGGNPSTNMIDTQIMAGLVGGPGRRCVGLEIAARRVLRVVMFGSCERGPAAMKL